jgi:hypothetical protein
MKGYLQKGETYRTQEEDRKEQRIGRRTREGTRNACHFLRALQRSVILPFLELLETIYRYLRWLARHFCTFLIRTPAYAPFAGSFAHERTKCRSSSTPYFSNLPVAHVSSLFPLSLLPCSGTCGWLSSCTISLWLFGTQFDFGESGTMDHSCHECGEPQSIWMVARCTNPNKAVTCGESFCFKCLGEAYPQIYGNIFKGIWWLCPACIGLCKCETCSDPVSILWFYVSIVCLCCST